jgi:hypothetical protein
MMPMATVKAMFYLPLLDNDGRDLSVEIEHALDEVYLLFGGWTWQGNVRGAFRMPDGSRSDDTNAAYMVVLDDARISELEQVLKDFKAQTTQVAIYLEIQRDVEIRLLQ